MAKSKKKTKFKSGFLAKFSKQQIIVALVFIIGFGGFGVWKIAFSGAASYPPNNIIGHKFLENVKAADGIVSKVQCRSVTGQTGYGPLANCIQVKPNSNGGIYRTGIYSPITKIFNQDGGWLNVGQGTTQLTCKNMNYQFRGTTPLSTGYGPLRFGQIYRYYSGKWQIKWSNMSIASGSTNGQCSVSGGWMDAKPW